MASGITYDGVASTEGGNIFQDKSFWVAQRVPTRNDILSKIRNNGGVVVPLEKNADFLIADHARKDAPAGSYSWKFITESVQHGALQVEDRYRIGPDPNQPRPVGGAGLTRAGRVPFTHADKAALAKWVLSRPDLSRQGNELYQQWEKINSRHTWQSWRNHFVKALQPLDHHDLKMLAATAPDDNSSEVSPPEQTGAAIATPKPENVVVRSSRLAAAEESAPVPPSQGGRTEFSKNDDAIIATWAVAHSMVLTTDHFKDLEEEQPHHSWESWRNRWNKRIRKYSVALIEELAATIPENTPASNAQTTRGSSTTIGTPKAETTAQKPVDSKIVNSQPTTKPHNAPRSTASLTTKEPVTTVQMKQVGRTDHSIAEQRSDTSMTKVANVEQGSTDQPKPSHSADALPAENGISKAEVMTTETGQGLNVEVGATVGDNEDEVEGEVSERDRFFLDLINFKGTDIDDFEFPVLKGPAENREVDLYELARAYDAQGAAPEDIDWDEVARTLGWETQEEPWLGPALQKCFEEQLIEFLEAMNDLSVDNDPTELGIRNTTMPSSPPVRQESPKRRRDAGYIASTASVRKRRRLQNVEVPSTPDEQVGITRELRQEHGASLSPSLRRVSAQPSQQLPLLQNTPIRTRSGAPGSVRPLELNGAVGRATGRKDQDTSSEEDVPTLLDLLRSKGKPKSGRTPRRSLPASFAKLPPQAEPSRRTSAGQQMPSARTNTALSIDEPLKETVSDWVDRHLRTGYPEHILKQALHHTSLVPGPSADHIVDSLANDNGIPADLPGVWLPHEDRTVKLLMATDFSAQASSAEELTEQKRLREEQRRLIERHTWEGLSKRKKYLREHMGEIGETVLRKKEVTKRPTPAKLPTLTQDEKKRREMELRRMMEDSGGEKD